MCFCLQTLIWLGGSIHGIVIKTISGGLVGDKGPGASRVQGGGTFM